MKQLSCRQSHVRTEGPAMELLKLLFVFSLIYIAQSASIVKSVESSDDVQAVVPESFVEEEIIQKDENENVQKDVLEESEELKSIEKEITKIQQNNIELKANRQSNGEIHIPVAIVETPISSPVSDIQPKEPAPQSDVQTNAEVAPPAPSNNPPPPPPVQQDDAQQNIFQQLYTSVTSAFQNSIQSFVTTISGYFGNIGNRSPSIEDSAVIEKGLKKLQGSLQQGLRRLNNTYEAYVKLNHKNRPEETSSQDVADSQLLENQLRDLQQQITDGTRDVEESIKSINSVGKAEATTQAPSNPGGIFQQAISNFQQGIQNRIQNINSTFQGFLNRGQNDAVNAQGDATTARPPGFIQQGLQSLQQGFQQSLQNFQNLVRPQGAQAGTQSEETASNRPNIFQQGFQNLQQGFQNLLNRPGSQPAANPVTENGAKETTATKEKAEDTPKIPGKSVDAIENQNQNEAVIAEKTENVNETPANEK